uniref:Uncharacterized protein n=1 Tax=Arundo donax TaxID=35708 RepID=A0A0A9AQK1_ARUDO
MGLNFPPCSLDRIHRVMASRIRAALLHSISITCNSHKWSQPSEIYLVFS